MRKIAFALCLLATSAQALEYDTYIHLNVWSPMPAGVPRPTARNRAWYGDGIDAFQTLSDVKLNPGDSIPAGMVFTIVWDPEEVELCPYCKAGQYPTGWLVNTPYETVTVVPGWPFLKLTITVTQTNTGTTPKWVHLGTFWWLGTKPQGGSTDPDIWLDQLPPGSTNHFVHYTPISAACNADVNGDGVVGAADWSALGSQWGQSCAFDYE